MRADQFSRRDTLRWAAAGSMGVAMGISWSEAVASAAPEDGWVDAHSHIWTREVDKYPLAAGKTVADLAPPSFTAEELLRAAKEENVDRVVLISHFPYYGYDNRYLLDAATQYPQRFRVVAALDEKLPDVDRRMRELLTQRVTGFRVTPFVSGESWLDTPGMEAMWRTAANTRQAMCCLISPEHLEPVARMCEKHRATPVVIDHFARVGMSGEIRREDLDRLCGLARFESVSVKISAYYALGAKKPPYHDLVPMIKRLFESFGPQRLMWASDAPYQVVDGHSYRASIALIRDHLNFVSAAERTSLLRGTAEKVFFFA